MTTIEKKNPPTSAELELFLKEIGFKLPFGFIDFFKQSNGADINSETMYINLWPLTEMIKMNELYNVNEYAPEFFIFGSDGGDTAYAIEKGSSHIFNMPFIGMSKEEASFICKTFDDFIKFV